MLNLSRLSIFTTFLLLAFAVPSFCMTWCGKVVSVSDGDTIKVLDDARGSAAYRRAMVRVQVERTLADAFDVALE